ncbi:MAG: hypothetical protein CVV49_02890 [Spirochaetae bacterium HGW-Spirochaetae-5]|nr:MAG: hypothetical protein CVV49_02890 [Spirochaetae bacterium HGW-Spirochaetae-5]
MHIKKILLITLILLFVSSAVHPRQGKKLTVKGLKIFTEEELFTKLHLSRFEEGKKPLAEVISSIEKFYRQNNYKLVKVYAVDVRTSNEYAVFVDEGRLGRIIVHGLNKYYTLKFKQQIDIPERIYNTEIVNQNLIKLKSIFPKSVIKAELKKPDDYEGNLIQLDRELKRLELGEIFDTTFFDTFNPVHDLHFTVGHYVRDDIFSSKRDGFGFEINYKFPSLLIPEIDYYKENFFFKKDYLETALSAGFDFGLSGLYKFPPENTFQVPPERRFAELNGEYKVSPMQNNLIGPLIRGLIYHSTTSRTDLGITEYKYFRTRGTLAPEFTLSKNVKIYTGLGMEQILIYDSQIDYSAEQHLIDTDNYYQNPFAEARVKFDPIPLRLGNRIDKFIILTYTDYLSGNSSKELDIRGTFDSELDDHSILSLKARGMMFFNNTPFYKSENVSDSFFKGFGGESYYTNKSISFSGEYRFSIYLDYVYVGAFLDLVLFEPEGFLLSGTKQGTNIGPTARFLVYDQFELIMHLGFDRLLPDNKTGITFKMKFTKKW